MNSAFERLTLEGIERNFGADLFRQASYLYDSQAIIDLGMDHDNEVIWGVIDEHGKDFQCQVKFQEERIMISCTCGKIKDGQPCAHVVTLIYVWVKDREKLMAGEDNQSFFMGLPQTIPEPPVLAPGSVGPTPEKIIDDYHQKLSYYTVGQMRDLAGRRGIKVSGQRRDGILNSLSADLSQPENLAAAIQKLSASARLVFDLLLIMYEDLDHVYLKTVVHWIESAMPGSSLHLKAEPLLDELVQSGLAFLLDGRIKLPLAIRAVHDQNSDLVKTYEGLQDHVEIASPSEFSKLALWLLLLSQAGALECSPVAKNLEPGGWPALAQETGGRTFKDSRERAIPPLVSYLKPEALRRLAPAINYPGEKIDYAARLLGEAALWEVNNPRKLAPSFSRWLQLDVPQQSRSLFEAALSLEAPVELDQAQAAGGFKIQRDMYMHMGYKAYLQGVLRVRRLFFKLLRQLPVETWLETDSVLRVLHGLSPDFNFESNNQRLIWMELKDVPVKPADYNEWRKSYGYYYQSLLTGTAFWMGICDIAWQAEMPVGFRITRFGKFLLGDLESIALERVSAETRSVFFQKDGVIEVSPANAEADVIGLVMLISKIEPVHRPSLAHSGVPVLERLAYRVQNEGLGRAFETGWTAEKITEVLEKAAMKALPVELAERIRRVGDHYGRLHIYQNMTLIQFGDDFCLPELLTGTRLGQSLLYQFSPRLIAVRPDQVQEILNDLRSKGYTPRMGEVTRERNSE